LLIAPDLLGQSLSLQLTSDNSEIDIALKSNLLKKHPSLVIWSIESLESLYIARKEVLKLKARWKPTPILLLLPSKIKANLNQILEFECAGLLQDPEIDTLNDAISTLLNGGRVVKLREELNQGSIQNNIFSRLSETALTNCLKLIDRELKNIELLLNSNINSFYKIGLKAHRRELSTSRSLMIWFWSPLRTRFAYKGLFTKSVLNPKKNQYTTDIVLNDKNNNSLLDTVFDQLSKSINGNINNQTNSTFAFEAFLVNKQTELINSLLSEVRKLLFKLSKLDIDQEKVFNTWNELQIELREQSIRSVIGNYERLIYKGELISISDKIISIVDLNQIDDELPDPRLMLNSMILNKPITINGALLSPDDPRSLIKLQLLLSNWLVRNIEIISSELINACALWPGLRNLLLHEDLIATRELERLRNHLNSQARYNSLIRKPIQLYESKRTFYELKNCTLNIINITEPRDDELLQLDWWQRQVALIIEARDALSPQIQYLVKYIGNLMVVILTNIVGRALGLIGKGIAQGMGRTITNK